jgi:hypothetical protein
VLLTVSPVEAAQTIAKLHKSLLVLQMVVHLLCFAVQQVGEALHCEVYPRSEGLHTVLQFFLVSSPLNRLLALVGQRLGERVLVCHISFQIGYGLNWV